MRTTFDNLGLRLLALCALGVVGLAIPACGDKDDGGGNTDPTGGTGGASTGGRTSGGTGGAATGGRTSGGTGGRSTGGSDSGGTGGASGGTGGSSGGTGGASGGTGGSSGGTGGSSGGTGGSSGGTGGASGGTGGVSGGTGGAVGGTGGGDGGAAGSGAAGGSGGESGGAGDGGVSNGGATATGGDGGNGGAGGGSSTVCTTCIETNCSGTITTSDALCTGDAECEAYLACLESTGCADANPVAGCYCGTLDYINDPDSCFGFTATASDPNGACKAEIEALVGSTTPFNIALAFFDASVPLGAVNQVYECRDLNCSVDCGLGAESPCTIDPSSLECTCFMNPEDPSCP